MENTAKRRVLEGVVVSAKMQKTVVVQIDRMKMNSKYKKQYRASSTFKVHDEKGECKVGDKITFEETRPISKDKRFRLISRVAA